MRRSNVIAFVLLVLGLIVGWFAGRWSLESQWSQPILVITPDDARRSAEGDANPTPATGTRVLRAMPLQRSRLALRPFVNADPVFSSIGSVGRGSQGEMELNVTLRNRGRCAVTAVDGVAYGFDAWGQSAKLNRAGEYYMAFHSGGLDIAPGATAQQSFAIKHADVASIVLAQVDRVTCADGTNWARR